MKLYCDDMENIKEAIKKFESEWGVTHKCYYVLNTTVYSSEGNNYEVNYISSLKPTLDDLYDDAFNNYEEYYKDIHDYTEEQRDKILDELVDSYVIVSCENGNYSMVEKEV